LSDGTVIEAGSPRFFCCAVKTVAGLIFLQHIQNTFIRHYVSWPGGETTNHNAHFKKARKSQSTFLQQGRADEAIAHHQKALAVKPDCAEAHNYLGLRRGRAVS
jgi:hypothetical protein